MNCGGVGFALSIIADLFLAIAAITGSRSFTGVYIILVVTATVFAVIELNNRSGEHHVAAWLALLFGLGGILIILIIGLILGIVMATYGR